LVHKLDFRDPGPYMEGIDWIRSNVVLKPHAKGEVLQLDIALRKQPVTLYMDPRNHYIMGFQGADRIYLLDDEETAKFKSVLKDETPEPEVLKGLGGGHHARGLGTFRRKTGGGVIGRTFQLGDLETTSLLPNFSRKSGIKHEQLRLPLSLLVCMISESARIPMMQRDFKYMYYRHPVRADDAMRSYADAKFLMDLAARVFPEYPFSLGVEKLVKRASVMAPLLDKIQVTSKTGLRGIRLIDEILPGKNPSKDSSVIKASDDFRYEWRQLKSPKAATVSQLLSTCRSEGAVRAALQGVVYPPVSHF
jgi:hypothetical protein